jgi:hypothetical protein
VTAVNCETGGARIVIRLPRVSSVPVSPRGSRLPDQVEFSRDQKNIDDRIHESNAGPSRSAKVRI